MFNEKKNKQKLRVRIEKSVELLSVETSFFKKHHENKF